MTPATGQDRIDLTFLGHAVDRSGPPIYLRHLLGWLAATVEADTHVVSLDGGALAEDYRRMTDLRITGEPTPVRVPRGSRPVTRLRDGIRRTRLRDLRATDLIHVNTSWSVRALRYLPSGTAPVVAHVHELEVGLDYHLSDADSATLFDRADHWVAASQAVADNLVTRWGLAADDITVHHEMIDIPRDPISRPSTDADDVRRRSGIPADAALVGTAAVLNWRKAPDLFVELAARLVAADPQRNTYVAWVGVDPSSPATEAVRRDLRRAGIADRVHLIPTDDRPDRWMRAFDVFVLPAREDAYPLACLEAAAQRCPVVCFEAGGMPEFVGDDAGAAVPFPDVSVMATVVDDLLRDADRRARAGAVARRRVIERHAVSVAAPRIWEDLHRWATER